MVSFLAEYDAVVWANIGVAGAKNGEIRSVWAVNQVFDVPTERRYHPDWCPLRAFKVCPVRL